MIFRLLSVAGIFVALSFADTACVSGAVSGMTNTTAICNVSADATNPSGQTYGRTIGVILYPTDKGASNATCPIYWYGPGKGWTNDAFIPFFRLTDATQLRTHVQYVINNGGCIWGSYETASARVTGTGTSGASTISVTHPANQMWPNDPNCMALPEPQCGHSYPYTAIFGGNTVRQESVSVTGLSGSGNSYTLTISGTLANSHTGDDLEIPATQWPMALNDRIAELSFVKANAGQGTYPGNPYDIRPWVTSSDSHNFLMAMRASADGTYLSSCPSTGWFSGVTCGSSNSATGWQFGPGVFISTPLDLAWMYDNSNDGGVAKAAIRTMLGCIPNVDTGCTTFAQLHSPAYHPPPGQPDLHIEVGDTDLTTPVCATGTSWPCATGQFWTFQSAYRAGGLNFIVFAGVGHGCNNAVCRADMDEALLKRGKFSGIPGVTLQ